MKLHMTQPDDESMPAELRLDLLVDGELGEHQRRELLLALEREPAGDGGWKKLALRFLQRQAEKESVKRLMAGGTLMPVEIIPAKRPVIGRIGLRRLVATAAGLLIAVTSALITLYAVRPVIGSGEFRTELPPQATASDNIVTVSVPTVKATEGSQFIPAGAKRSTLNSVIIQPDGNGGAIVIPVNTVKAPIY